MTDSNAIAHFYIILSREYITIINCRDLFVVLTFFGGMSFFASTLYHFLSVYLVQYTEPSVTELTKSAALVTYVHAYNIHVLIP